MLHLGVNIDHVATVREARRTDEPDPVTAAAAAERVGADSIVCHLREDRRHIQDRDLRLLRKEVRTRLNLEMALSEEIVQIALEVKPDQVTLVPERRQEVTTEGGLDVVAKSAAIARVIPRFRRAGIEVSLFIDPDVRQIETSRRLGAGIVEFHTGAYANARTARSRRVQTTRLKRAAHLGRGIGLFVAAGHGLTYRNVGPIVRIGEIEELNIGHSIVSRALFVGMERAVRDMKRLMRRS